MAKIVDLLAKCEESEIFTQNLGENITEMQVKGANGLVTFMTDPKIVLERMMTDKPKVGIVIWFPADVFER